MNENKKGILLTFDLKIDELKKYYSSTSPKNAYKVVRKYLEANGFENRKDSDYVSYDINYYRSEAIINKFAEKEKWFSICLDKISITEIKDEMDLTTVLKNNYVDHNWRKQKEKEYEKSINGRIEKAKSKAKDNKGTKINKEISR